MVNKKITCTHCEKTKNSSEFYRNKSYASGYYSFCIVCYKQKQKTFRPIDINIEYDEEKLKLEKWKKLIINGEEFPYKISDCGRIVNLKKDNELFIKYSFDNRGYPQVVISSNKKRISRRIHRLVSENFIENTLKKPQVNHIDGNKLNNHISNLEWCTQKENIEHANKMGLRKNCYGKKR